MKPIPNRKSYLTILPQHAVTETREVGKISRAPLFMSVFPAPAVFLLDHSCCRFSENTQPSLR